jgi:hypothetical protein
MILVFSWTTEALLAGQKTVTRRDWADKHAAKFREGVVVQAYDKNPRNKGIQVGTLIVKEITRQRTGLMTRADYRDEGFAYLYGKNGVEDASPASFEAWRRADVMMWVCRFEIVESMPVDEWKALGRVATPMNLPGVSA